MFPLDDLAAVSGFEAYINGRHIVGQIKEKQTAHREYREAISKGHGAYLLDQDEISPDIFQVSIGNLPPEAEVIIKITYVTELEVIDDSVCFHLPPAIVSSSGTIIQSEIDTQVVADNKVPASFQVFFDMPYPIKEVSICSKGSATPKSRNKKTETKALVDISGPTIFLSDLDGIKVVAKLTEIHKPRMWLERDNINKDNYAAMVVFYPEFNLINGNGQSEFIILLDSSFSMSKCWNEALEHCGNVILSLPDTCLFNIVSFSSAWVELFPNAIKGTKENKAKAIEKLSIFSNSGCTYATEPFLASSFAMQANSLNKNIILISDGNFSDYSTLLEQMPTATKVNSTRLFVLETSGTRGTNRHNLRVTAHLGGGMFISDTSVMMKRIAKLGFEPSARNVELSWDLGGFEGEVLSSPKMLPAVFNHERIVSFALLPSFCPSANLKAYIGKYDVSRYLTISELDVRTSTIIHRLATRSIIREEDRGILNADAAFDADAKSNMKGKIIELSKRFGLVSKYTSFIAIEERDKEEKPLTVDSELIKKLLTESSVDLLGDSIPWEIIRESKEIFIKTLTGKTIGLGLRGGKTVLQLKEEIFSKEGIPPSEQRLIAKGKQLMDEETVDKLDNEIVHLVLRLRGGRKFHFYCYYSL